MRKDIILDPLEEEKHEKYNKISNFVQLILIRGDKDRRMATYYLEDCEWDFKRAAILYQEHLEWDK